MAQIATAIADPVQVTMAAPSTPGAPQTMTIQLKPIELGRVEIRIERSADGPTRVDVAVERTDTLMLLVRDQPQLHQALDQAGVPQEGRSVNFSLAADTTSNTTSGSTLLGDGGGGSGAGSHGSGGQRSGYPGNGNGRGGSDQGSAVAYTAAWSRSGIDITA